MTKLRLYICAFLLISCLCLFFYANSLHNPFILDDEGLITKNSFILDWKFWPRSFGADLYSAALAGSNFYRPLQTLTFMWDYHFWQFDQFGYHLTNLLLQALAAFLVFLLTYTLSARPAVCLAGALLFAVSPLHTEAVAYISGRAEMLMGIFALASLLLFIKSGEARGILRQAYFFLSLAAFVLGLLSKELALALPLAIAAYVSYYRRDKFQQRFYFTRNILPFAAIGITYAVLRHTLLRFSTLWQPELAQYPLLLRLAALPKVFFTYLKLLLLPLDLHMSYAVIKPQGSGEVFAWLAFGAVLAACFYFLIVKREKKNLSFFIFWFFLFLLPQSGIFPINAFVAEHFIYLSSVSFFLLLAYLLRRFLRHSLFIVSVSGLTVFYGVLTMTRNYEWRDPASFYEGILKFSPLSVLAHNNLGVQYEKAGLNLQAVLEYKKAIEIKPLNLIAHSNLANIYQRTKRFVEAEEEYKILEKITPCQKAGELQNNIGTLYENLGQFDKAIARYKLALLLDSRLYFVHFNLARVYLLRGERALARQEIIRSLSRAFLLENKKSLYEKIIEEFLVSPGSINCAVAFYNDIGVKFAQNSLFAEAQLSFKRALELAADNADAHFNLGLVFWKKGQSRQAKKEFRAALLLNPAHQKARGMLRYLEFACR